MAVQKQTQAGQRIRFKAFVTIGGYNSHHVGLSVIKWSKVVATAIRGVIILTKLSMVSVQRGYWATRLRNTSMRSGRPLWLYVGTTHACPQRHQHSLRSCAQEANDDQY